MANDAMPTKEEMQEIMDVADHLNEAMSKLAESTRKAAEEMRKKNDEAEALIGQLRMLRLESHNGTLQ